MKNVSIIIFSILMSLSLLAQVPSGINYQTIIRDSVGLPIADTELTLKMTIRSGAPDGVVVYDEIHNVVSNAFGLVNLVIGNGSPQNGNFHTISWGTALHFLEVSLDIVGNNQWTVLGVTQFVSVPYSLNSGSLNLISPNGTNFEVKVDDEGNLITDCYPDPTQSDAGPDQWIAQPGVSATLLGNTPVYGIGNWSVISGEGGMIEEPANPVSIFTGIAGEEYVLEWTISNSCGATSDDVTIIFEGSGPFQCGNSFIDPRDGQVYGTVQIDTQCWISENMNVGTRVDGVVTQTDNEVIEKYCYDDLEENCDEFGGLYQWNEMMEYSTIEGVQGICPEGWHVATDLEWFQMTNFLDPTVTNPDLQGWQGTDIGTQLLEGGSSGFEAKFSGYRHASSGLFLSLNDVSSFWTSTFDPYNTSNSWFRKLENGNTMIYKNGYNKAGGVSVRCVKSINNPAWSCGDSIIDPRDEQSYNTVQIGEQCWMAENLNIGARIKGVNNQTDDEVLEKYCYDDLEENCDQYGALYQWNEMMQYTTIEGTQGICPDDWHLATDLEWFQMTNFLDPTVTNPDLQSWQGTDIGTQLLQGGSSGFEAKFSGYRHASSALFLSIGEVSSFWTSTFDPYNTSNSWFRKLEAGNTMIYKNGYNKAGGVAVRCILD